MDNSLITLLRQEIEALTAYINNPPDHICKNRYLSSQPINLRFGPDVETIFMKDGKNIMATKRSASGIIRHAKKAFQNTPTEHASIMARLDALHLPSEISLPQALPHPPRFMIP